MKCHILFSEKNKKNIINLSSAENAQRVVKVKAVVLVLFVLCVALWMLAMGLLLVFSGSCLPCWGRGRYLVA